jgi:hypothetical protein
VEILLGAACHGVRVEKPGTYYYRTAGHVPLACHDLAIHCVGALSVTILLFVSHAPPR